MTPKQFQILVYPSKDKGMSDFIAHCLNFDILADGDDIDDAILLLLELIEGQIQSCKEHGANLINNAPKEYFEKFEKATPLPEGLLNEIFLSSDFIKKEQLKIRISDQGFSEKDCSE